MGNIYLGSSEDLRLSLTAQLEKLISDMFGELTEEIEELIKELQDNSNVSAALQIQRLEELKQQLIDEQEAIANKLLDTIPEFLLDNATGVIVDIQTWMAGVGIELPNAFAHVPIEAVQALMSGSLYSTPWSLSSAIWRDAAAIQQEIMDIVAKGLAANKSALEVAQDLEKYVNPGMEKPWEWRKTYPGTRTVIDYNAQRLARTMMSQAYQYAFVATTKNNPFVSGYVWHSAYSGRSCELCQEMDGSFYEKNALPLDHPNGMCFWEAYIPFDMNEIADRLGDWANGATYPELDKYIYDALGRTQFVS